MSRDFDGVDVEALAGLRPGAPEGALRDAMGRLWRPPAPHRRGLIDGLMPTHGVTATLAADGRLGRIDFFGRADLGGCFDAGTAVEGLRLGMSPEAAVRARPDLGPGLEGIVGARRVAVPLAGAIQLHARFEAMALVHVAVVDAGATYPEAVPAPWPDPEGEAGTPFGDANLKLLVLSALIDAKAIDLGDPEELIGHVLGRPSTRDDRYDFHPEVRDYLARYPLTPDLLAKVEKLVFDGGNAIYFYAYPGWSGETDEYDVGGLAGIAHCPNLRTIDAGVMLAAVDFRDLAPLRRLEEIDVMVPCSGYDALLGLPSLRRISVTDDEAFARVSAPDDPARGVLDALKARGVAVRVNWFSNLDFDGRCPPPFT